MLIFAPWKRYSEFIIAGVAAVSFVSYFGFTLKELIALWKQWDKRLTLLFGLPERKPTIVIGLTIGGFFSKFRFVFLS